MQYIKPFFQGVCRYWREILNVVCRFAQFRDGHDSGFLLVCGNGANLPNFVVEGEELLKFSSGRVMNHGQGDAVEAPSGVLFGGLNG